MRSNSNKTAKAVKNSKLGKLIRKASHLLIQRLSWELRLTARYLSLGMQMRQWAAMWLICLMLLPILVAPASGARVLSKSNFLETVNPDFEPVNAPQTVWNRFSLNAKLTFESLFSKTAESNIYGSKINNTSSENKDEKDRNAVAENSNLSEGGSKKTEIAESATVPQRNSDTENVSSKTGSKPQNLSLNATSAKSTTSAAMLMNQLPIDEQKSRFEPDNNLGAPPGQTEMDSSNEAAALRIRHRPGAANFSFGLPLASLSGRGINAGIGMTYNSRTWNKSCSQFDQDGVTCVQSHFAYDVEQSWIAPGFSTGFGYLETQARIGNMTNNSTNNWYTFIEPVGLTDPDGTRHELTCKTNVIHQPTGRPYCGVYTTTDGSFIEFTAPLPIKNPNNSTNLNLSTYGNLTFATTYKDGTAVFYTGGFGTGDNRRHYPERIRDRNGNYITIAYKNHTPKIDYINDTLDRRINFYYENDSTTGAPDKLVTITIPGMGVGDEIQTVRFYYDQLTFESGGFTSNSAVTAPTTIRVLKYVFMPATKTGYKYDYHPKYGMITKITRQVGMSGSTDEETTTGQLNEGIFAASTEYNYPTGNTALNDVPKYDKRTDDWQGRPSSMPPQETYYNVPANGDTNSIITVKDNDFDVVTETVSYGGGMIKETSTKKQFGPPNSQGERPYSQLLSKSEYTWVGSNLTELNVTNEVGLTKKTKFTYETQYNNQTKIEEFDFGTANPTLLRTTEIEYETGTGWINNKLLSLPKSVKVTVGGTVVSKTLYEYDHGGNDTSLVKYDDIINHDNEYNPLKTQHCITRCDDDPIPAGYVQEEEVEGESGRRCFTYCTAGYNASTKYRGNVTRIERLIDTNATLLRTDSNANYTDLDYDIAGNVVSATLSCCQLKTTTYSKDYEYAFPVSQIKGSLPTNNNSSLQLTTSATYNKNTGLVMSTTDENNNSTSYEYEGDTLRLHKTVYPNGAYAKTEYGDKLAPGTLPGFVRTTSLLDTNKTVQGYSYFNGRGDVIRSATQTPNDWSVSATEFDKFGRPLKSYNPFYASTPTGNIPNGTRYSEVLSYDAFGRATKVKLQDESIVESFFNESAVNYTDADNQSKIGIASRVKDQADKERRQVIDALGRVVRVDEPVDEPTRSGLGTVESPYQPSFYSYDGNGNLSKIVQIDGTIRQERRFKYDPLSRLTHEKQIEATPTLDGDGNYGAPNTNNWTKVLKYDNFGRLLQTTDARNVKTNFVEYDGLNRIRQITFSDGTPQVLYTYDQARNNANGSPYSNKGQVTRIETAEGGVDRPNTPLTATEFNYDSMGRLKHNRQTIGTQNYDLEYGYNLAGQLTSQKYPSGKIVSMNYDDSGRLSSISDQGRNYLNNLQYNLHGGVLSAVTLGNGIQRSFVYNDRLQVSEMTWAKNGNVVQRFDYTFGEMNSQNVLKNNGKLAQIDSYSGGSVSAPTKQFTQKFVYDAVGRLKSETEFRGDNNQQSYKQVFDYDRFGNRYLKVADNPSNQNPFLPTPIEENNIDKMTNRLASNTGTVYDNAGNVTIDGKFRNLKYFYDASGRMYRTSSVDDINQANSVYDGLGQRVATQINGVWKFFIYNSLGKTVAEYGGTPATDEGGVKYVHQDVQGSTRAITSVSGAVKSRIDYAAFGEEIQSNVGQRTGQGYSPNDSLRQKYAQTERDEATDLNHTWFRKYENRSGRWTSPDPYNGSISINDPQSFNKYSYVKNQPTNFIDPTGLQVAGEACSYSGDTDENGDPVYDGVIDATGRCVSTRGSDVMIYWEGWLSATLSYLQAGGYNPYDPTGTYDRIGSFTSDVVETFKKWGCESMRIPSYLIRSVESRYGQSILPDAVKGEVSFLGFSAAGQNTRDGDVNVSLGGGIDPKQLFVSIAARLKPTASSSFRAEKIYKAKGTTDIEDRRRAFPGQSMSVTGGYLVYGGVDVTSGGDVIGSAGTGAGFNIGTSYTWNITRHCLEW